jgi:hypothetical protein
VAGDLGSGALACLQESARAAAHLSLRSGELRFGIAPGVGVGASSRGNWKADFIEVA